MEPILGAVRIDIGIIGNGFVGQACRILTECKQVNCVVYDIDPEKCIPRGATLDDIIATDIVFVCVPTPSLPTGQCDTSIVERVVQQLKDRAGGVELPGIVVRSTVPPGTCERLEVMHMPEYLTEKNWDHDFRTNPVWHVGVPPKTCFDHETACYRLQKLFTTCKRANVIARDDIQLAHSNSTEMTKYMRNCMLAVRVSLCNEFEAFCRARNIDYNEVREMALQDPRIPSSHTMVPGHDGKRGYGGTCLPKDLKALKFEMDREPSGAGQPVECFVLDACDRRNDTIDRPQQDWKTVGRSVSE